jgi:hypothetical protein
MNPCEVYHCERIGDGTTCHLAAHLRSQAEKPVMERESLSKTSLLTLIAATRKMAHMNGCACVDEVEAAATFALGVAETL